MFWLVTIFLVSCDKKEMGLSDCENISEIQRRDDCWSMNIIELIHKDKAKAIKVVETAIQDQRIRDYTWLTITREYNPATRDYCKRIVEKALAKRCMTLVSRPHLHREILRGNGEKK